MGFRAHDNKHCQSSDQYAGKAGEAHSRSWLSSLLMLGAKVGQLGTRFPVQPPTQILTLTTGSPP